jgi:hypothetical protein
VNKIESRKISCFVELTTFGDRETDFKRNKIYSLPNVHKFYREK